MVKGFAASPVLSHLKEPMVLADIFHFQNIKLLLLVVVDLSEFAPSDPQYSVSKHKIGCTELIHGLIQINGFMYWVQGRVHISLTSTSKFPSIFNRPGCLPPFV